MANLYGRQFSHYEAYSDESSNDSRAFDDYLISDDMIVKSSGSLSSELPEINSSTIREGQVNNPRLSKKRTPVDKEIARSAQNHIDLITSTLHFDFAIAVLNMYGLPLYQYSTLNALSESPLENLAPWQSDLVGPMAHQFAISNSRTVIMTGSQHRLRILKNFLEISAPICDANSRPIAAISMALNEASEAASTPLVESCICMLHAIAQSISQDQTEKMLARRLSNAEDLAANILGYIDDGILVVSSSGLIQRTNKVAFNALGIDSNDKSTLVLHRYLTSEAGLAASICSGSVFNSKRAVVGTIHGPLSCLISCRPLANSGASSMSIIRIKGLDDVDASVVELRNISIDTFDNIVGCNPSIVKTLEKARFFASTNASILIVGSTGTGKSQLAHAIHNASNPDAPFIAIKCGALPKEGADRFLFGSAEHDAKIIGAFEQADGGTLYLDEICDLSLNHQALLLTLNDSDFFTHVGSAAKQRVNFRIIASSTRALNDLIKSEMFRSDLYYRISVVKLELLDLADRIDDVPIITRNIIAKYCASRKIPSISITNEALSALVNYSWPGNVRQLRTSINYACDICKNRTITSDDLPADVTRGSRFDQPDDQNIESLDETRRKQIIGALRRTNGNVAMAAKVLGIGRSTLYKLIKKYNIPRNVT